MDSKDIFFTKNGVYLGCAFKDINLEAFNNAEINVPVILGGAALTPKFVNEDCSQIYKDAYKRPFLFSRFGIIGIYETIFIMLSGNQLLTTVQSLPDADIKQVVKTCGYTSIQKNGTEKLNFTDFYVAILKAKGSL